MSNICKNCGNNVFNYDDYWNEYICTECAHIYNGILPKEAIIKNKNEKHTEKKKTNDEFKNKCYEFVIFLFRISEMELLSYKEAMDKVDGVKLDISQKNLFITFFMLMGISVAFLKSSSTTILALEEKEIINNEIIEAFYKFFDQLHNEKVEKIFKSIGMEHFELYNELTTEGLVKENKVYPFPFEKVLNKYLEEVTTANFNFVDIFILNDIMLITIIDLLKSWNEI